MILLKYRLVVIFVISGSQTTEEHCSTCKLSYKSITTKDGIRKCYTTIPHGDTIKTAADKCKFKGEKLPLPMSKGENDNLKELVKGFMTKHPHTELYVPLDLKMESNKYADSNGHEPIFTNWWQYYNTVGNYQVLGTMKFVALNFDNGQWFVLSDADKVDYIVCQQLCGGKLIQGCLANPDAGNSDDLGNSTTTTSSFTTDQTTTTVMS